MAYNKVDADGKTLIDLTSDTVTADTLVSGRTAHLANGEIVTGTFEPVTGVKGNAESTYRKGDVNLTPANIGAATSAQGTKADSAVQTIKMNGNAVTKTSGVVDLGTVITAHQNISGKADKSATVSTVTYDTTNKKLTKTINGTTSDVVTTAQLKTDMALSKSDVGLGNVDNTSDLNKPISTATQAALDSQQAQLDKALEQTGYNLFKIASISNKVSNGITYTVDTATGIVTANGTVTSGQISVFNLYLESNVFGNLNLSGCANGGSWDTYDVLPYDGTTFSRPTNWAGTANAESVFSESDVTEVKYIQGHTNIIQIRIRPDVTVSNLQFKPMLTSAELAGLPFQPYAKSNAELTQDMDDISGELDCLTIQAALVNNEVVIQNTSAFTNELYGKYFSYTKPKFAILKLQITSNTYYYKALINSSSVSQGNLMEASFITLANGEYIYNFTWLSSGTVGTPTVTRKALNLGS